MKKTIALLLAVMMMVSLVACGGGQPAADDGKYQIGVVQLVQHVALDAATEGFIDTVNAELGEENIVWDVQNAAGDTNTCNTMANSFVSANVDLIMANATPAVQAASVATGTIPVLGTSVTEYGVALGIKDFTGLVGTNVSGTSDLAPLDEQAQMIKDWCPDAKTVGLLYCINEANSQYQVDEMEKNLTALGFTCKQYSFTDSNDIQAVATTCAAENEVVYVPTDNTCASNAGIIQGICAGKVPVFCGEEGLCAGCGVATLSISYYDLGVATGKMAVKILKGEANVADMPIEYAATVTPKYNADNCAALGLTPPANYVAIEG